jgi:hypothetical protein
VVVLAGVVMVGMESKNHKISKNMKEKAC